MTDLAANLQSLDAAYPIALLPVRIETRFVATPSPELLVRVYPDELAAELGDLRTADAAEAARDFWRTGWQRADELDAWRRLVQRYPAHVAGLLVELHRPDNWATRPAGTPSWTAAPPPTDPDTAVARLLPDGWIVVGQRDGVEVLRFEGSPIISPLALGFRRDLAPDDPTIVEHDGLRLEPALRWTVDFEAAVAAGMGMRIPITGDDLARGFDRLTVYGARTDLPAKDSAVRLAELLTRHRGTRGLALVPQGTPTNNTGSAAAGYPPPDDPDRSFAIERGEPLTAPDSDGELLARALGIDVAVFAHVEGAGGREQQRARAMNQALWPCTLGYFLTQMMSPVMSAATVAEVWDHFARFVRGRGPLPAFRVGRVPYGVLPVTPLWGAVDPFEQALVARLSSWQPLVLALLSKVSRVGRTGDPNADLLGALALDASTREVRLREVVGPAYVRGLLQILSAMPDASVGERAALTDNLMTTLGLAGQPRVGTLTFSDRAPRVSLPMVAPAPLSEESPLADNYIAELRSATTTGQLDPAALSRPLLFHLLRQASLVEYHRIAVELAIAARQADPADRREVELVGIPPPPPGRPPRLTPTERFAQTLPVTGGQPLGTWLLDLPGDPAADNGRQTIRAHREALQELELAATAELERLLTETLDVCSHRLDAWNTSLATRRLQARRAAASTGVYLGAYAFVENLRATPGAAPGGHGGFVHAPSVAHAATAAILRNGYLTNDRGAEVAIDLSSQRVRRALSLFDGVRHGQSAGAVLGYWFERGLHDRQLDRYLAPFRRLYPLGRMPDAPDEGADEQVAARNVVNGLALRDALLGRTTLPWTDPAVLPAVDLADRPGVEACLAQLEDDVDAAADLLAAESVYQAVQGNTDRAAATLASGAGTGGLPTPGIVTPPSSGIGLTHRVAIVLGVPPTTSTWPLAGVRRLAEPRLAAWLGDRLGSPAAIRCRARHGTSEVTIGLDQLGLSALDVVMLAAHTGETGSELAARVEAHVRATTAGLTGATAVVVDFTRPNGAAAWPPSVLSFDEALEAARLLSELVAGARPLAGDDLLPPHAAGAAATVDLAELAARAVAVASQLAATRAGLAAALAAAAAPTPSPTSLDDLRAALWAAAGFGIRAAAPVDLAGVDAGARAALVAQGAVVQAELSRRDAAVAAATADLDRLIAAMGGELPILTPFTPANRLDLDQALAMPPGNPLDTRQWLERMARVRDPLDRLRLAQLATDAMNGQALTAGGLHFEIAQLPYVSGAPWIGATFDPSQEWQRPRAGTVGIALHRAPGHDHGGSWSGLLLDHWAETIPSATQLTAYAVHHPSPGAEAPQCVLLAVAPPTPDRPTWTADTVEDCLTQAYDVARMRAVDSDLLDRYALMAPCIYLAANIAPDTVRSPLAQVVLGEATIVPPE